MGIASSHKGKQQELVEAAEAMTEARSDNEDELDTKDQVDDDDDDEDDTDSSSDDDDNDNNDEDNEEEDPEDIKRASESNRLAASMKGEGDEPCSFDLRNLLGINSHTIDTAALYQKSEQDQGRVTIPSNLQINEEYLLKKAQQGCHQLLKSLWQLPQEQSDVGALVTLPTFEDSRLPRALVRICSFLALMEVNLTRHHLFTIASPSSPYGNQMGKVRQSQGHRCQPVETIT